MTTRSLAAILAFVALVAGCAAMRAAGSLPSAIMGNPDPETVRQALPSYLVAADAMIIADPSDSGALSTGSRLYALYASLLENEPERAKTLTAKSLDYASRALCMKNPALCGYDEKPAAQSLSASAALTKGDLAAAADHSTALLLWMQARADNPEVLAKLPKIEGFLTRMAALDEKHDGGRAHFYLGILKCLRPPALGGDPDAARRHFERAVEISEGKNLSFKVEFAGRYARMVYDRQLHDGLLTGVLAADPNVGDLTLTNAIAKAKAKKLLDSAEDYF